MKIIKQLIKEHRFLFMTAVLFTFLSAVLSLCWNKYLAEMIDLLGEAASFGFDNGKGALTAILPAGIFVILLQIISEYFASYFSSCTCEIFAHDMRMGYAGYYLQSDIQTLSGLNAGEEQSAMQNELKDVSDYLHENLFPLIRQSGIFVVTVVFLLCQNLKLALLSTLPAAVLILYCAFSGKIIKDQTMQCQDSKKKINGLAEVILELFPVIRIYDACQLVKNAMRENLLEWERANIRKERVCARLMSLSGVLSFVPLLLLLGTGGLMVINKEITLGIFYIFINLSGNVSGFFQNMPGIYAAFRQFGASVSRLEGKITVNGKTLCNCFPCVGGSGKGEGMEQYAVYLDDISFSYGNQRVIRNLSLKAKPGEHIGIVGESGCGKSTLLKILAGLYGPDGGEIVIAGERFPEGIRKQAALVMQGNSLFPLSIRDNITCGHEIPEEKVWDACQNASLTKWIEKLPKGLDTDVGEQGSQVSGGQAQRIQIARALCKDAPIILLDEPVSALDQETGYAVLAALNRLTEGRTVIHVTHHRETLDESYRIYYMEGGKLSRE